VWQKAVDCLRMALALYIESRSLEKQRKYSENEAAYSMTKARKFISNHQDSFGEFIKDSPLYVPPLTETTEPDKQPIFDYDNQDNAIFVMRPQAFTRH
jgi:hypothetical protein